MPKLEIELRQDQIDIFQAEANEKGIEISDVIASGRGLEELSREKLHQALGRCIDSGKVPAELVAMVVSNGLKAKEAREQAKAKAVV